MKRIRYLFLGLFFIFSFLNLFCNISLNLEDIASEKNEKTQEETYLVKLSDTFTLVISANNVSEEPQIEGLDNFHVFSSRKQSQLSFVMGGKSSSLTKYIYQLKPKKEGEFILGPAKARDASNNIILSNSKKLKVTNEVRNASSKVINPRNKDYFLNVEPERTSVVLGEPIICKAKLYSRIPVQDIAFSNLSVPDFLVQELSAARRGGQEYVNGKLYSVIECRFLLTPMSIGEKEVPPFQMVFSSPMNIGIGFFNFGMGDQFSTESEPFKIMVEEIPIKNKNAQFIGIIDKFTLSASSEEVNANEPFTLTLQIDGAGNFDYLEAPSLELSDDFKYFEPSTKFEKMPKFGLLGGSKKFDYIVQTSTEGSIEIPPQKLIYFDTSSREIKTIISNSLTLQVRASKFEQKNKKKEVLLKNKDENKKDDPKNETNKEHDLDRFFSTKISDGIGWQLPFWMFIFLFIVPIFAFYGFRILEFSLWLKNKLRYVLGFDSIEKRFRTELLKIKSQRNQKLLYHFFIDLCSEIFNVKKSEINEDSLWVLLKKTNFTSSDQERFIQFFSECSALSYGMGGNNDFYFDDLIKQAESWLSLFFRNLRYLKN